ncbi:hypothetical protein F7725_013780 [Dissostichus mawsoni]|uniref:MABP domain-containing protein n=1 Tax=Dissostichus mawsoni TaxID=36200 RepID=A0A7J5YU06_DISMA|nr:hypothetical protein F7725_013780 [Dissostichus mawsoni]
MTTYISELDVSLNAAQELDLKQRGFNKINVNLNKGAGGYDIYLWYKNGPLAITKVQVSFNDEMAVGLTKAGYTKIEKDLNAGAGRLACDLNRNTEGNCIHVWLKREEQTYICDVIATDSYGSDSDYFQKGYIRVDEDTNRGAGGAYVFIWYRQTTDPEKALKDLQVSITDSQHQEYQKQDYQRVVVDLNQGTGGNQVFLWYKKRSNQ